jgi:hypothetical protein
MLNEQHLFTAFSAVFDDLCRHGLAREQDFYVLWRKFERDMADGFASLFEAGAGQCRS